jgi:hypothetical protein
LKIDFLCDIHRKQQGRTFGAPGSGRFTPMFVVGVVFFVYHTGNRKVGFYDFQERLLSMFKNDFCQCSNAMFVEF